MNSSYCRSMNAISTASHSGFPDSSHLNSRNSSIKVGAVFRNDYLLLWPFGCKAFSLFGSLKFFIIIRDSIFFLVTVKIFICRVILSIIGILPRYSWFLNERKITVGRIKLNIDFGEPKTNLSTQAGRLPSHIHVIFYIRILIWGVDSCRRFHQFLLASSDVSFFIFRPTSFGGLVVLQTSKVVQLET